MQIRLARPEDASALLAIYRPFVESTAISFEHGPLQVQEFEARITKTLERFPWLVAEEGAALGYAYAGAHRSRAAYQWSTEVSVYVGATHHRRGVGRRLYEALLDLLRRQGFRNAYAGITLPNEASERLHTSLGFERIGVYKRVGYKLGAWHDVAWFSLNLSTDLSAGEPAPPMSIVALDSLDS